MDGVVGEQLAGRSEQPGSDELVVHADLVGAEQAEGQARLPFRRGYLIPGLGARRLIELERQPSIVEDFVTGLAVGASGKPLSPASVRRVYATLRAALNTAVRRKLLAHNPALAVELPEAAKPRAEVWTAGQVGAFLDATEADRLHALYLVVVMAGLRRGGRGGGAPKRPLRPGG